MEARHEMLAALKSNRERPFLDVLREWSLEKKKERQEAEACVVSESKQEKHKAKKRLKLKFRACGNSNFVKVNLCESLIPSHYVKCPISDCQHSMDPIDVMAHYITQHQNLEIHRIYDDGGDGFEIKLEPFDLPKYESICLAVLAFAGKLNNEDRHFSATGYRKFANDLVPKEQHHLKYDLPILIMASRNIVYLPPKAGDGEKRLAQNLIVIWPVTLNTRTTARDLYCWIMAKDPKFMEYRSTLVEMRSFEESQDPTNLLNLDNSTFRINMKDVEKLILRGKPLTLRIKCKLPEFKYEGKENSPTYDSDNESNRTFVID